MKMMLSRWTSIMKWISVVLLLGVLLIFQNKKSNISSSSSSSTTMPTEKSDATDSLSSSISPLPVAPMLSSLSNETSSESCGLYYFYHVGKTGGSIVQEWQKVISDKDPSKVEYFQWYYLEDGKNWTTDFDKINQTIYSDEITKSSGRWLSVHQQHRTPGLRRMIQHLRIWRELLQSRGCQIILATVIREPFSHAKSLLFSNNVPIERFDDFLENHMGQARYLLFNLFVKRSPYLTPEQLDELLEYLQNDFDIVGRTDQLDVFIANSLLKTGWEDPFNTKKKKELRVMDVGREKFKLTEEMSQALENSLQIDQILWERMFSDAKSPTTDSDVLH